MEEVDKILIHALRQAGTEVPSEVQSVGEFSPELVVEAAVKCLRTIRPALGASLSPQLPPSISGRFRLASDLAVACQELGFGGDMGYQTFLYSSEADTRRLLLFLVEKLPRDERETGAEPPGKPGTLLRAIGSRIRQQLGTPWVPPSCRPHQLQRLQGTNHLKPFTSCPLLLPRTGGPLELQEYFRGLSLLVTAQPPHFSMTPPSLLEVHLSQLISRRDWDAEWGGPGLASRLPPQEYLGRKKLRLKQRLLEVLRQVCPPRPPGAPLGLLEETFGVGGSTGAAGGRGVVLPKGSRFTHSQHLTHKQDPQIALQQVQGAAETPQPFKNSEEATGARWATEEAALQATLQQLEGAIEGCRGEIWDTQLGLSQVEAEVQQRQLVLGRHQEDLGVKLRALELLPDAQGNLAKLQSMVETSSRRIVSLAGQWEKHRGPLLAQYRQLRALRDSTQLESSHRLSELCNLHQRSRLAIAEARRKEQLYKQLVSELESLPHDVSRSVYTQRILEIVGNIRKQKEDIGKILVDTRTLQKEINSLGGKLERTFSVTDELLFKDAKRDEVVRKAYKYLAALHENCAQLIQTIEDTGTIQREIRDLEEQIEGETSAKPPGSLDRILSDCRALREENALLAARARNA
ncbi:CCD22 protein, partial [Rhinopomastus cyanomelas]|nr:CCD22 protein [Rhinopomastus cyanomelas]